MVFVMQIIQTNKQKLNTNIFHTEFIKQFNLELLYKKKKMEIIKTKKKTCHGSHVFVWYLHISECETQTNCFFFFFKFCLFFFNTIRDPNPNLSYCHHPQEIIAQRAPTNYENQMFTTGENERRRKNIN